MFIRSKAAADHRVRSGLVSYFLLEKGDVPEDVLGITWVDVEPGARQRPHNHFQPQVYILTAGAGFMRVGDEEQTVSAGDLIYIPPNAMHGITNTGSEMLSYISAATPTFDLVEAYDRGQLTPDAYS